MQTIFEKGERERERDSGREGGKEKDTRTHRDRERGIEREDKTMQNNPV